MAKRYSRGAALPSGGRAQVIGVRRASAAFRAAVDRRRRRATLIRTGNGGRRMRAFLLGAILAAASGAAAPAQDTAAQIKEVISDQIEAFRVDDVATAFSFASPAIRDLFGTADRFGEMVREGYPMVWHPGRRPLRRPPGARRQGAAAGAGDRRGGSAPSARVRDGPARRRLADRRGAAARRGRDTSLRGRFVRGGGAPASGSREGSRSAGAWRSAAFAASLRRKRACAR